MYLYSSWLSILTSFFVNLYNTKSRGIMVYTANNKYTIYESWNIYRFKKLQQIQKAYPCDNKINN